ncbi:HAMP domain-containing sensor histidine kinase, partial [Helicobacter typhlonius]|uniref:sensor histidine kinase n=1 Tax=Helicobacter typhlonius TaxID=76936 RepID=UPI002FE2D377
MNSRAVITILVCIIILLAGVIIYQQFVYKVFKTKYGIQAELKKITQNISDILDNNTDEKVMVFTDNKIVMDLCGQINRLVLDRQKIQAGYKKQEISLKKMLANISHDIKTPLTVISGYLEIMRINGADALALQKAEAKANQVAGLVNQFFTLAKLEAGDMVMDMENVNISELCRENILDFYEILTRKDFNVDISVPEENIYVYGDKRAIERILI